MFHGARHTVLILVAVLRCAHTDTVIATNEKRHGGGGAASNYQTCLDSFDVHQDKIIKTQDSQRMGAKYLSVLDVDSRLDCLEYCCGTERCDVFIFEEKVRVLAKDATTSSRQDQRDLKSTLANYACRRVCETP